MGQRIQEPFLSLASRTRASLSNSKHTNNTGKFAGRPPFDNNSLPLDRFSTTMPATGIKIFKYPPAKAQHKVRHPVGRSRGTKNKTTDWDPWEDETPMRYDYATWYFAVLSVLAFLLYTALYAVDLVLVYWTFVPGYFFELAAVTSRLFFRHGRHFCKAGGLRLVLLEYGPGIWRSFFGQQYAAGPMLRRLDGLRQLSVRLEIVAFAAAVLLVASLWGRQLLWRRARFRPARQRTLFALLDPWEALGVWLTFLALATPPEGIKGGTVGALARFVLFFPLPFLYPFHQM